LRGVCGKKEKEQELFQQWDYFGFLGKTHITGNNNIIGILS
jgi:hypothetical protein